MSFFSYYLEVLLQEYVGAASFNVALFSGKSSFTEAQTDDAVNEVQNIIGEYDVFDDEYVGCCLLVTPRFYISVFILGFLFPVPWVEIPASVCTESNQFY